ncbi:MAG: hypothetical protein ACI4RG_08620, partial [Huintestinicola sp.]
PTTAYQDTPSRKKRLKRNTNNLILIPNKELNGLYRLNFQYKPFSFIFVSFGLRLVRQPPSTKSGCGAGGVPLRSLVGRL